jgi:septal ring factor EnvC (AmiA/AmiB activator)
MTEEEVERLTEPLSDRERELRQRAQEVEQKTGELSKDRVGLALKAMLGGEQSAEELAALDERVSDLKDKGLRFETEAAKERTDEELRRSEAERKRLLETQGLEERVRQITNTRRQLMIDAGALGETPGSADMVEIALRVEYQMHQRFGEEAKWRLSADDAEFGLEWRDGSVRSMRPA